MAEKTFNLTTEPWIKVLDTAGQIQRVSLIELFNNAAGYRQLAGEMRAQDLAILRLLLAILTTVYSRYDADDEAYEWLTIDEDSMQVRDLEEEDQDEYNASLSETWQRLFQMRKFSASVTRYLQRHADQFDLFGSRPFYQVTAEAYDALVPTNKRVATGTGQVAVKQINRTISESANTPSIFAPKTGDFKEQVSLDELVRWLITYQNFTGVTDKTKIVTEEKFSNSAGWLYRLNPVFAEGRTLFETLMLNLILKTDERMGLRQRPVWEYDNVLTYVKDRKTMAKPDNLAELYTTWSRILHLEWDTDGQLTIFSAGIPIFEADDTLIEPMTTWRRDKKTNQYRPAVKGLRSLGIAMWRNFGQYVRVNEADDVHEPGIVTWLHTLQNSQLIDRERPLTLVSVAMISDGNATSQAPAAEMYDDMSLLADVLFDTDVAEWWPVRIEDAITLTQTIGTDFYHFASDVGRIRNIDAKIFASGLSAQFYARLNEPFKAWLVALTGHDDREQKIAEWKRTVRKIVFNSAQEVIKTSSPRDISGIKGEKGPLNIFTANNRLKYNVKKHLGEVEERSKNDK